MHHHSAGNNKIAASAGRWNLILFVAAVGWLASPAMRLSAVILTVQNPSFEDPVQVVANNYFSTVTPTDWSAIDPDNNRRVFNKNMNVALNTPIVPNNVTGDQAAVIGVDTAGINQGTDLYQLIGTSGGLKSLTLTVDAAERTNLTIPTDSFTMGIWMDTDANSIPDLPLATTLVPSVSLNGSFQPFSVTGLSIPAGIPLYVRFTAADIIGTPGTQPLQTLLDNVRLDEGPVPEPASMALLLLGGTALLARRGSDRRRVEA